MPGAAPVGDSNKKAGEHPGAPHFQSRFSLPEGPTGTRTTATQQSQCGPRVRQSSYGEYMMYRASTATPAAGGSRNPRRRQSSLDHSVQRIQQSFIEPADQDMMGPLLRRKKVLSVPIGGAARAEDDFFAPAAPPSPGGGRAVSMAVPYHRDLSISPGAGGAAPLVRKRRNRNSLSLGSLITRKQVSMDLYAPEAAEFFEGEEEEEVLPLAPTLEGEGEEVPGQEPPTREEQQEHEKQVKLFKPLRFSPPAKLAGAAVDHREFDPGAPSVLKEQDDAVRQAFDQQQKHHQQLKRQIDMLTDHLEGINDPEQEKLMEDIQTTRDNVESDTLELKNKLFGEEFDLPQEEVDAIEEAARRASGEHVQQTFGTEVKVDEFVDDFDETGIIRARKKDYTWTGILLCVMIAFTGVVVGWETHLDETYSTFGVVGLACATPCEGSLESQDYFNGHSQFEEGQFIQLTMQIDPTPIPHTSAIVEIVGVETNHTKKTLEFGPVGDEVPETWVEKFEVDFDHPHEDHIINVHSSNSTVRLTYKLHAATLSHLAKHSELIAALIMIFVYIFILLEVIHRTLVAIFGSLVALLFFFLIHHVRN